MSSGSAHPDADGDWRAQLEVGRMVEHHHFGTGQVRKLSAPGDRATVTVDFGSPFGILVLRLAHTTLRVLPAGEAAPDGPGPS